jgi:hypothetical protein
MLYVVTPSIQTTLLPKSVELFTPFTAILVQMAVASALGRTAGELH